MIRVRLRPDVGLAVLLIAFVLLGTAYAFVTPLFEASDELWHYPMVKTIADGHGLPVQDPRDVGPWRQEGSQPPLYYYIAALATRWIDTSDAGEIRWLNPHVDNGVITPDGNINLAIHTYRERWPWRGTVLAVRLIRLLSVMMSAGTVYFTYRLAQAIVPNRPGLALAASAVVAFTPMFLFISGAVNNDNLASLLSAATLWLLVHLSRHSPIRHSPIRHSPIRHSPIRHSLIRHLSLGLLLGLAALTKESTLGLFPLAAAILAYNEYRRWQAYPDRYRLHAVVSHSSREAVIRHAKRSFVIRHLALVFGLAGLIAGWWYWRNYVLYGDFLGLDVFIKILGQRAAPASLAQLWSERGGFMQSYWGLFGGVNVPMADWVYAVLNAVAVLSAFGLVVYGLRKLWAEFAPSRLPFLRLTPAQSRSLPSFGIELGDTEWPPLLLAMGWVSGVVISLIRWATVTWSSQGRLVFSAISAISTLLVIGLAALVPRRVHSLFFGALAGLLFGVSVIAPFVWIAPSYVDPPVLSPAQLAALPNPVGADFGGEMKLLGYGLEAQTVRPGQTITVALYWQSQIAMDRDWSVFVHLLDGNDIVVAQRDTYPGLGLMPTRKMTPGQTLEDRYVIRLPQTAYAPANARLQVGLYDFNTGERLPIADCGLRIADCSVGGGALTLAPIAVEANPGLIPNPLSVNFGEQMELAGYELDRRAAAPGETLHLTLYWRGLRTMRVNYSVFAHVRGEGESLWAQMDSWPQRGAAPTSSWVPGEDVIGDTYDLSLKPDTPAGVYQIEVGLYDSSTGDRLQIVTPEGRLTDNFVSLSPIRVVVP